MRVPALGNHVVNVVLVGSQEQVNGIDAELNVALVADKQADRDVAAKQIPGNPMYKVFAECFSSQPNGSIPFAILGASPEPASTHRPLNPVK
jgi:hypothetical protein